MCLWELNTSPSTDRITTGTLCHCLTGYCVCLPVGDSAEQSNHGSPARLDHFSLQFPCPAFILQVDLITTANEGAVVI